MAPLEIAKRRAIDRPPDRVARSAEGVTFARAFVAREPDVHVRNPDYLAHHFLDAKWGFLYWPYWLMKRIFEWWSPGARCYNLVRTRHIDGVVLSALERGVEQVVLLAAGNDSRPYRFQDQLHGKPVFEVDLPGTQAQKQAKLIELYGALPGHVTFVPIDFNSQPLARTLIAAGYDPSLKTLFNWEGVTFYLPQAAIDATLELVRDNASSGSEIVFDYCHRTFVEGDDSTYGAKAVKKWLKRIDEPFVCGWNEGELEPFLDARGLELVSDLGGEELVQRYALRADGTPYDRPLGMCRIAHARSRG
jgi:methyltransferase (TIGR00027 family)